MINGLGLLILSMLRFMRGAPGSTISVCAGITIGIVSITGVHVLGERIGESLDASRPAYLAGVTHVLTRESLNVADLAELRRRWRRGELAGVTALIPVHEHVTRDGVQVVGTDWIALLDANDPTRAMAASPMLAGGGDGGVSDRSAAGGAPALVSGLSHAQGTSFELNGVQLKVIGSSSIGRGLDGRPGGRQGGSQGSGSAPVSETQRVVVDIGTAYAISGSDETQLDAVFISRAAPFASLSSALEGLMPGISAGLPAAPVPVVPGFQVHSVDAELPAEGMVRAVLFNLGALGTLSLLVALLLMYQTATLWLRRQQRVLQSLHEVGVPRSSLLGSFIGALSLLAMPATVLGIVAGTALATVLQRIVLGEAGNASLVPGEAVVIKAIVAGLGIAVLGGTLAWSREYRQSVLPQGRVRVLVMVTVALGLAGWLWPPLGLAGIFLCILAFSLLAAFSASPLLHALKTRSRNLSGPLWLRLGLRETAWFPADLIIACAALALAVAVSIGVGLMVDSFRREFSSLLDARLSADLLVTLPSALDAENLAREMTTRPEVTDVVLSGEAATRVNGLPAMLGYGEIDAVQAARYGHASALGPSEVLINETLAGSLGVSAGSGLQLGTKEVHVAGVFKGYGETGLRMIGNMPLAEFIAGTQLRYGRLAVNSSDPDATSAALRRLDGVEVSISAAVRERSLLIFDRTFATSDALTWLALIIASGALINALIGFRMNQLATGRLLESVGVPPAFNLAASLVRACVVVTAALVIAIPLGLWLGFILCSEVNPRAFGWTIGYSPTIVPVLVPALLGLCAAALAGCLGGLIRLPVARR